jgi:hypothetical protein
VPGPACAAVHRRGVWSRRTVAWPSSLKVTRCGGAPPASSCARTVARCAGDPGLPGVAQSTRCVVVLSESPSRRGISQVCQRTTFRVAPEVVPDGAVAEPHQGRAATFTSSVGIECGCSAPFLLAFGLAG